MITSPKRKSSDINEIKQDRIGEHETNLDDVNEENKIDFKNIGS